jgi:hypothetical protein
MAYGTGFIKAESTFRFPKLPSAMCFTITWSMVGSRARMLELARVIFKFGILADLEMML